MSLILSTIEKIKRTKKSTLSPELREELQSYIAAIYAAESRQVLIIIGVSHLPKMPVVPKPPNQYIDDDNELINDAFSLAGFIRSVKQEHDCISEPIRAICNLMIDDPYRWKVVTVKAAFKRQPTMDIFDTKLKENFKFVNYECVSHSWIYGYEGHLLRWFASHAEEQKKINKEELDRKRCLQLYCGT